MSDENVEKARRIYDEWGNGNFRAGVELYDPHIVLVQPPGFAEPGEYLGLDGVSGYMQMFLEAWERVTISAEELVDVGDSVVARVVQRAVGRGSGVHPADLEYFQVWSFRGGKVIRLEVVREREDALRAAGLSE